MKIKCLYDDLIPVSFLKTLIRPEFNDVYSSEDIHRVAELLKYQGIRNPIRISKLSGYIVGGYISVLAAELNNWEKMPINMQEYEDQFQELADMGQNWRNF